MGLCRAARAYIPPSPTGAIASQTWICRTVRDGVLSPNSVVKFPFEVYSVPLSGMGFIGITYQHGNFAERIVYFVLYFLSQVWRSGGARAQARTGRGLGPACCGGARGLKPAVRSGLLRASGDTLD